MGDAVVTPDRLRASWRRSEDYGVPVEGIEPVYASNLDRESLFFECGQQVLAALHATLVDEPISLMLTDRDGLVLNRLSGDARLLRSLDAVHLAPGFAFSEREAGTSGLGLALADQLPALVRAHEHYSASLVEYTCAAVPVLDPVTGRLEGSVNVTTWAPASGALLLALAQSAAGHTTSLMLARSTGRTSRPAPTGAVFNIRGVGLEPGDGTLGALSRAWTRAVDEAAAALRAGHVVAAVGERGSGRATLLAQARRRVHPRERILRASPPAPPDIPTWLSLWLPELGKPGTAVIVSEADTLPLGAAGQVRDAACAALMLTGQDFAAVPAPLAAGVRSVVSVPALRERPGDVLALAHHAAQQRRGHDVSFTPAAARALEAFPWPGNVEQLVGVVGHAATLSDTIDLRHLPADVFARPGHRLTRIEALERAEIVRCLTQPGATVTRAAAELGMSRATIYRKIAQYDVHVPKRR